LKPQELEQLLHKRIDPISRENQLPPPFPPHPGSVWKRSSMPTKLKDLENSANKVILVREETNPKIFTDSLPLRDPDKPWRKTSHAAVVREVWEACVSGCEISESIQKGERPRLKYSHQGGRFITIDGSKGEIYLGEIPTVDPRSVKNFSPS